MKIYPIDVAFLVTAGGNLTLLGVYGNLDFLPDFISSDVFMVVLISAINYLYGVVALQSWTKPQWVVVAGIVGTGIGILLGPVLIMCQVPELIATLSAIACYLIASVGCVLLIRYRER